NDSDIGIVRYRKSNIETIAPSVVGRLPFQPDAGADLRRGERETGLRLIGVCRGRGDGGREADGEGETPVWCAHIRLHETGRQGKDRGAGLGPEGVEGQTHPWCLTRSPPTLFPAYPAGPHAPGPVGVERISRASGA